MSIIKVANEFFSFAIPPAGAFQRYLLNNITRHPVFGLYKFPVGSALKRNNEVAALSADYISKGLTGAAAAVIPQVPEPFGSTLPSETAVRRRIGQEIGEGEERPRATPNATQTFIPDGDILTEGQRTTQAISMTFNQTIEGRREETRIDFRLGARISTQKQTGIVMSSTAVSYDDRKGTIKEKVGDTDWQIQIQAMMYKEDMKFVARLTEQEDNIIINEDILNTQLNVSRIVITNVNFPHHPSGVHQPVMITAVSDRPEVKFRNETPIT